MHKSRIGVILIDHPEASEPAATRFWAAAIGADAPPDGATGGGPYTAVGTLAGGMRLETQRIGGDGPARVHLDIETDDVVAETARLVALGASVLEDRDDYRIMLDPGGLIFCIVPIQTTDFAEHAVTWSDS